MNDFFLLIWGEKQDHQAIFDEQQTMELSANHALDAELFCDSVAIVLIINPQNLTQIAQLEESKKLLNNLFTKVEFTKENIQKTQKTILRYLITMGDKNTNTEITKRLDILRKEEIVSYDVSRRIISLVALIEEKKIDKVSLYVEQAKKGENFYQTSLEKLITAIKNLKQCVEDAHVHERLDAIPERLANQRFSIGITGVMNAGKSTMLNALLGQEILGTSVVPETANLTVINYAQEPYAVVNFWNAKEWKKIEEGAHVLKNMETFVLESKEHFKEQFEDFITETGRSERIAVSELALYTSAKHSDKKCNLVKSVELYTDLKFVKDGVSIVDTPGLDDPVIQREEITLEYLSQCDLLIHLMNAAQAATQKDIDFIIDALLYRNVAQLLVVITRIDAIKEHELQEVITYVKKSIEERLKEQNKVAKLDAIIARLAFIPIAGKLALWHKLGQAEEALALGYSFERTGIPYVENYLSEVLFGEQSQKASLVIASNQKEIEYIAHNTEASLQEEKALLQLSYEQITHEMVHYEEEKKSTEQFLERIDGSIRQAQEQMQHYFQTLEKFALTKCDTLQSIIKRRISDDVSYERNKHKRFPKEERIAYMVESGIKDGFIDLIRDYRYEFQKKMQSSLELLQSQYKSFAIPLQEHALDTNAFYEEHLKTLMIFKNNTVLIHHINDTIKEAKADISFLIQRLDTLFAQEFIVLKETLAQKLVSINDDLLAMFVSMCESPANAIREGIHAKDILLKKAMLSSSRSKIEREQRKEEIEAKLDVVHEVIRALALKEEHK
ncbi:MAG: dynamin family protein [Sulfurospirillaceae bacterium]|nr:dynamin family protein [Sulfurospirillaceae bacterium]